MKSPHHLSTPRRSRSALWCGVPVGPPTTAHMLSDGISSLAPALLAGGALVAAAIWMINRWGAKPPALPPGVAPEPRERSAPEPGRSGELPAPA